MHQAFAMLDFYGLPPLFFKMVFSWFQGAGHLQNSIK